jgi:polyvinyl alcohol dehydrogenase (cytochrome)
MTKNFVLLLTLLLSSIVSIADDGATIYAKRCAQCHDESSTIRAPRPDALRNMSPEGALAVLTEGTMKLQAASLSEEDRRALAEFVTGKKFAAALRSETSSGACPAGATFKDPLSGPRWLGWGAELSNARFQSAAAAGLKVQDIPKLKLKWAFGIPDVSRAWAQPVVAGGRVFVGTANGKVYSLDAATGCVHWTYDAGNGGVRTAISIGPAPGGASSRWVIYFGDRRATVYAVDAATGQALWKTKVDDFTVATITGSPVLFENKLYVPVSSGEEVSAVNPQYECCKFRGSVVALDVATGKVIWKTYTIAETPAPTHLNKVGVQMWGPAGGAVWSAPTIDAKRRLLYVGTGNAYSEPDPGTTDSVLAIEMDTGKVAWARQMTAKDWYSISCSRGKENCPEPAGPDFDLGGSPILRTLANGKTALTFGQKSGMVFGIDPDKKGAVIWETRVGRGSSLGGVEWGSAADEEAIYVPVSDVANPGPEGAGSMNALDLATGKKLWTLPSPKPDCTGKTAATGGGLSFGIPGCSGALSAAATAIPGAVFAGSIDGHFRAYAAADGKIIWDVDTAKEYTTVNGVKANGGSLDAAGAAVVNGVVYVNSGYGVFQGMPGNVLLAFSVDGK